MSKENTIKQCILIGEPIASDYESSNVFNKMGTTPIIQLCINWLADNGIKQIFLFYSKQKLEIEDYHQHNFSHNKSQLKVHLNYMKPQELKNFGDVMREVQFRNIVAQDFLVLYADTISNFSLSKAIESHFRKKVELRNIILTTILKDNSYDKKIHIINSQTNEILQIDEDINKKFSLNQQKINLKKIYAQLRRDLTHCEIYICTMDVLKNFKENYQFTNMLDFVNGMLTSEVFQEKIIGYVLGHHQCSFRINKIKDYYLAYINFIGGHFYPYTLNKIKSTKTNQLKFVTKNFNKVIFNGVSIPRTTYISNNCYVGQKSTIGHNSTIQKSIITENCQIGNNVTLKNCLILKGCIITQKSTFENCIIQKINGFQQIKIFSIFPKYEAQIVTEPLFQQTPPPESSTFEEQLQQVISQEPRIQIVNQLNSIRKHHNKSLQYFLKQMIRLIAPSGTQGVQQFAQKWGPIILKIHQSPRLLLDSLFYSCQNIPAYEKAFHVFIQYLYNQQILKSFIIQSWYTQTLPKYPQSLMLQKCQKFINYLKQQQQEEGDEEEEESAEGNKNKQNKDDD